ncbi:SDR family oxidoreductase [Nocardia sp. NBC_00508]|uniref:SDR family NAD(P)-dependent oxidoreductase n=1 Tax=Nocardia sp. NBC_00508 TaxID=2975992 RepID=UPI002E812337|nr:SDR family oxidoreductase [Nocardia sp. NBC_00508]WUD67792.1 SDR family oxidoreductase [Nocardia sp. NBC_00508]
MAQAVVTGAAGAIGAAICRRLARNGYDILAVDIDEVGLKALCEDASARIMPYPCDITDPPRTREIATAVGCRCELLVHAAGVVVTTPFEQVATDEIDREVGVDMVGPMLLTHTLFPALRAAGGHIVAVVSLASMLPLAECPGYSASKFGLRGFLLSLAAGTRRTGVQVSIVNPGAVDTPMLRYEAATGGSPLAFLGTPLAADDIAERVVALVNRPRVETNVPGADGWLVKIGMLAPGVTLRLLPHIGRLARRNLARYRARYGIPGGSERGDDPAGNVIS